MVMNPTDLERRLAEVEALTDGQRSYLLGALVAGATPDLFAQAMQDARLSRETIWTRETSER